MMSRYKWFFYSWILCLVTSIPCWSQTWSTPQTIPDSTSSVDIPLMGGNPLIGVDAQGNAFSVWINQEGMSMAQLVTASRFDTSSGVWSTPVTIGQDVTFGTPSAPSLAVTTDGKAIAIWRNNGDTSLHYNVYNQGWLGEGIVDGAPNESFPQVAIDGQGHAIAIWLVGGGTGVMASIFDFNLLTWSAPSLISFDNSPNFFLSQPVLAVNPSGQAIAVWLYGDTGTSTYLVQSNFYTNGAWGAQENIPSTNLASFVTPAYIFPVVTIFPSGQAIALFYQYDASMSPTQDYIALSAIRTSAWGSPFAVSSIMSPGNGDITRINAGISSDNSGNAIEIWEIQGSSINVQATTFTNVAWNNDTIDLASVTNLANSAFPRVAMDSEGDAFATWSTFDGMTSSIQVSQYIQATNMWGSPEDISTPNAGISLAPSIVTNSSGTFFDAWYFNPFASFFTLQASSITITPMAQPPASISGKQKINRFPIQSERFNQIKWTASLTSGIASYQIFRNGALLATVPATTFQYEDHDRKKNVSDTYSVFSVTATGALSATGATVTVP